MTQRSPLSDRLRGMVFRFGQIRATDIICQEAVRELKTPEEAVRVWDIHRESTIRYFRKKGFPNRMGVVRASIGRRIVQGYLMCIQAAILRLSQTELFMIDENRALKVATERYELLLIFESGRWLLASCEKIQKLMQQRNSAEEALFQWLNRKNTKEREAARKTIKSNGVDLHNVVQGYIHLATNELRILARAGLLHSKILKSDGFDKKQKYKITNLGLQAIKSRKMVGSC